MINQDIAREECDLACIACRVDAACGLVTEHAEAASAVTLVGVPNCGETLAAVQRAQRVWPVEILSHTQASRPQFVDLEIRGWPVPERAPARPLRFPRSLGERVRSWLGGGAGHVHDNLGRVGR